MTQDNPSGWFVDNNMEGQDVRHIDGATGRVLVYHPNAKDVALVQWDDDGSVQWMGADVVSAY